MSGVRLRDPVVDSQLGRHAIELSEKSTQLFLMASPETEGLLKSFVHSYSVETDD